MLPVAASGHALVFWPHATGAKSIPSGFVRDDEFADRYFQGASIGGTNGGGSHTHAQSHTHLGDAHGHGSCSLGSGTSTAFGNATLDTLGPRVDAGGSHTHAGVSSTSIAITYALNSDDLPSETSADPPYVEVIAIRPTASGHRIPQYGVVLSDSDRIPPDFAICDGSGDTVDLDGRFLRGAAAASDPGSPGGDATHDHGGNLSHTHDDNPHTHPVFQSGNSSTTFRLAVGVDLNYLDRPHHDIELSADLDNVSTDNASIAGVSNEPAYVELLALQNGATGERLDPGLIVAWTGDAAALASFVDWRICDGTGGTLDLSAAQVRCTSDPSAIGESGGANSHVHGLGAHNHTHTSSHDHADNVQLSENYWTMGAVGGGLTAGRVLKHTAGHAVSASPATPAIQNKSAWDSASADGRRPYRTVIWIQFWPTSRVVLAGGTLAGGTLGG